MNYSFRHPFRAALAPLGYRSDDGRTLAITGYYEVQGVAPVFPDSFDAPPVGFITRVDAYDSFLWAHGAMAAQHDSIALHAGTAVLCMDMDITGGADMEGDTMRIRGGTVRAARFTTPDQWAWGEVRP